jgi:hypothetical protein
MSESMTIGLGVRGLVILLLIAVATAALARTRPIAPLFVGGLLLVVIGMFYVPHVRVTKTFENGQSTSEISLQSGFSTNRLDVQDWSRRPMTALDSHAKIVLVPIAAMLLVGMVVIGGVVLFARAVSSKSRRAREAGSREPRDAMWHEPRRGGWGRAFALIGVTCLLGLIGVRFFVGHNVLPEPQYRNYASQIHDRIMVQQQNGERLQGRLQTAAPRPIETVIEEYERPRIPLDAVTVQKESLTAEDEATEATETAGPLTAPLDRSEHVAVASESAPSTSVNSQPETSRPATVQPSSLVATTPEVSVVIEMAEDKLQQFGLTFYQVAESLERRGIWRGAVSKNLDDSNLKISAEGSIRNSGRLSDALLTTRNGRTVYLRDVATITENRIKPPTTGDRPSWVDAAPQQYGHTLSEVVEVGEYSTTAECIRESKERVMVAVWEHLQSIVGNYQAIATATGGPEPDDAYWFPHRREMAIAGLTRAGIGYDYIRREIITNEYVEQVERSVGTMNRMYTQLQFSPEVDQFLRRNWTRSEQSWRVQAVSAVAFVSLSLVGLVWGLLKVDTITKGYYSKRLFLGVPALIVALVFLVIAISA